MQTILPILNTQLVIRMSMINDLEIEAEPSGVSGHVIRYRGWIASGFVILVLGISLIAVAARAPSPGYNTTSYVYTPGTSPVPQVKKCTIAAASGAVWYPSNTTQNFLVDFNNVTRQANFVSYRVPWGKQNTSASTSCGSSWRKDPYSSYVFNYNCYNNASSPDPFQNGHLVPWTAFGRDTCYMANAVPMRRSFNAGTWANLESVIRGAHAGMVATVGCEYTGEVVSPSALRGCTGPVQVPAGCFYAVLDGDVWGALPGRLITHGYHANRRGSPHEDRLAPWLQCDDYDP